MALVRRRLPNGLSVAQVDPGEAALLYREIFVEESYLWNDFPSTVPEVVFDIGRTTTSEAEMLDVAGRILPMMRAG